MTVCNIGAVVVEQARLPEDVIKGEYPGALARGLGVCLYRKPVVDIVIGIRWRLHPARRHETIHLFANTAHLRRCRIEL